MKTCPYCAEEIQDAAIICKHCGQELAPEKVAKVRQGLSKEIPAPKPQQPAAFEAKTSGELLVISQERRELMRKLARSNKQLEWPAIYSSRELMSEVKRERQKVVDKLATCLLLNSNASTFWCYKIYNP